MAATSGSGAATTGGGAMVIDLLDDTDDEDDNDNGTGNGNGTGAAAAPPSSSTTMTVRSRLLDDGCVELLDSDDDGEDSEDDDDLDKKPAARANSISSSSSRRLRANDENSPNKKPKRSHRQSSSEDEQAAVVVVAGKPPAFVPAAASLHNNNNGGDDGDDDDDIQLLGSTGQNALVDFPHARENCVQFPFHNNRNAAATAGGGGGGDQGDRRHLHCRNCYCFVCDAPAANCPRWNTTTAAMSHCQATYSDDRWKQERVRYKMEQLEAAANGTGTGTTPAAPSSAARTATSSSSGNPGFYSHGFRRRNHRIAGSALSVKTLMNAVTRVYPREQAPPPSARFQTQLRHYQKQSLAFMVDVESSTSSDDSWKFHSWGNGLDIQTRGGWLCSEVGMGKTAVVLALVASNPQLQTSTTVVVHGDRELTRSKATVVMTSVSLLGQWEDECKKHSPHLNVVRFHPSSQTKRQKPTRQQIVDADVVISSSTFKWSTHGVDLAGILFHRVVHDESHLFVKSTSADASRAILIQSSKRWCVTATPLSASTSDIYAQSNFLGIPNALSHQLISDQAVLRRHMIRHTKAQRINGTSALALPKSTSTVTLVEMTQSERRAYEDNVDGERPSLARMKQLHEAKFYHVTNRVLYKLSMPLLLAESSKIKALQDALLNLLNKDPNMRAVVFTQHRLQLQHVQAMVSRLNRGQIGLYSFDGGTSSRQRDTAIRSFQSTAKPGPAVFVVTLLTGSVGITLTAASHVFLMEPCIDPSQEVQAAGRISRLGQTKEIEVTKFAYKDTFESNVMTLHQKIEAGEIQYTRTGLPRAALHVLLHNV